MIYENAVEINKKIFRVIASSGMYGYDWNEAALLRGPDGKLYYASDSGCSCTWFGYGLTESDLTPVGSWAAAVELMKQDPTEFADQYVTSFAEELAKIRPAAFEEPHCT
ncbi:hypothetical protein Afil01_62340 [Actinorhabdospora filicis]|uniref:DUF7574 domain-containing protein n=1 Tax=Actinorhabdospora filicis TaxID=1785913 RepID=A0A9W6W6D8_9ACTN|nr:hypothetical protein [Actinorhabdospora filicis]GLZ81427.1 hypothetical protein Afil01_62340 [Actinorhabdospora filicis]